MVLKVGWEALKEKGLTAAHPIAPGGTSREDSMKNAAMYLKNKTSQVVAEFFDR